MEWVHSPSGAAAPCSGCFGARGGAAAAAQTTAVSNAEELNLQSVRMSADQFLMALVGQDGSDGGEAPPPEPKPLPRSVSAPVGPDRTDRQERTDRRERRGAEEDAGGSAEKEPTPQPPRRKRGPRGRCGSRGAEQAGGDDQPRAKRAAAASVCGRAWRSAPAAGCSEGGERALAEEEEEAAGQGRGFEAGQCGPGLETVLGVGLPARTQGAATAAHAAGAGTMAPLAGGGAEASRAREEGDVEASS